MDTVRRAYVHAPLPVGRRRTDAGRRGAEENFSTCCFSTSPAHANTETAGCDGGSPLGEGMALETVLTECSDSVRWRGGISSDSLRRAACVNGRRRRVQRCSVDNQSTGRLAVLANVSVTWPYLNCLKSLCLLLHVFFLGTRTGCWWSGYVHYKSIASRSFQACEAPLLGFPHLLTKTKDDEIGDVVKNA